MLSFVSTMAMVTVFSMMSASASSTDPESKLRIRFYMESTPPPGVSCEEDRQNALNIKSDDWGKGKESLNRAQRQVLPLVDEFSIAFENVTQLPPDLFVVEGGGVVEPDLWDLDDDLWTLPEIDIDDDLLVEDNATIWIVHDEDPLGTPPPTEAPNDGDFRHRRVVAPPSPPAPPVPEPCKPLVVAFNVRVFQPLDKLDDLKAAITEGFADFGFAGKVIARVGKGRHTREEESANAMFEHVNKYSDMHSMVVAVCLSVGTLSVIFAGVYVVVRKNRAPETNNKAISLEHV